MHCAVTVGIVSGHQPAIALNPASELLRAGPAEVRETILHRQLTLCAALSSRSAIPIRLPLDTRQIYRKCFHRTNGRRARRSQAR